ncbi:hypothetical protein M758_7G105800 [Ceratodon purpureus]|nr:hypothetical protein M758_7G105800 [Ceratodon purpureus]
MVDSKRNFPLQILKNNLASQDRAERRYSGHTARQAVSLPPASQSLTHSVTVLLLKRNRELRAYL